MTRAYKRGLNAEQRKLFRSQMWEFRRRPEDLDEPQRTALEALFVRLPALPKTELEEGPLAWERMAEEDEAKHLLAKLEKMAPGFFGFPEALAEFESKVLAHAEQEERTVFPILEQRLSAEERQRLAGDFVYVAAKAPSHAHAHSPESAVGNAVLGPVLATIDRVRDARR